MNQEHKWEIRFLRLAEHVSSWSKDPSSKVGAVITDTNRNVVSMGYNGFPMGIADHSYRLNNREEKYKYVVHAEMNAIYNAGRNGVPLMGTSLFVWGLPVCSECAKGVIQSGIKYVYIPEFKDNEVPEKWRDSWINTHRMFKEAGVKVKGINVNE